MDSLIYNLRDTFGPSILCVPTEVFLAIVALALLVTWMLWVTESIVDKK